MNVWRLVALPALLAVACGGGQPDIDDSRPKAMRVSPGVLVKDAIDARKDRVDWKDFSYFEDGKATIVFSFGDRFTPHNLQGEISLFDFDGSALQSQRIVPGTVDYRFTFPIRKEKDYFFRVDARSGKAGYLVESRVEAADPCDACGPGTTCCPPAGCCGSGQTCSKGTCVSLTCEPPCRRGEFCEQGRCEEACPGGCRKGKVCDDDARRCVSAGSPAPVPPRRPQPPVRTGCPACGAGQTCNEDTGECEGASSGLNGTVVGVVEEGSGVVIIVNLGSEDGVRRGAQGRVLGLSFTVRDVFATKCKAVLNARPSQVPVRSRVTIQR